MPRPRKGLDAPPPIQLFRLLVLVGLRLRTLMDQRLAPLDLTTQQAALLTLLGAAPSATQGELAAALGCTHQNVRQLLGPLQRKGLVETLTDPTDRRLRRFRTTPAVAALFADRDEDDAAAVRGWLAGLSGEEVAYAVPLLRRLLDGLPGAPDGHPGPGPRATEPAGGGPETPAGA